MRRGVLIAIPVAVVLIAVAVIAKMTSRGADPIGPLGPYVAYQTTFVIESGPVPGSSRGGELQTWAWINARQAEPHLKEYAEWLAKDPTWHIQSLSKGSVAATHGIDLVPDSYVTLDPFGDDYLLIYSRQLKPLEGFVDGIIYGKRGYNSPMPSKP